MKKLTQEMELAQLFLMGAYPESQGWELSRNTEVGGIPIAFLLRNGQFCVVVPKLSYAPFVSQISISSASKLKSRFLRQNIDIHVQVVMVYGNLLMPPENLPKDIVVVSVAQDCDKSTQQKKYDFCPN
ncbi:MAG: hypothetical protein ACJATE_002133 [Bacteroidia bacterium]|jgi:hypothetical protein